VEKRVSEWKCCFFFSGAVFFFRPLILSEWVQCKLFLRKKKNKLKIGNFGPEEKTTYFFSRSTSETEWVSDPQTFPGRKKKYDTFGVALRFFFNFYTPLKIKMALFFAPYFCHYFFLREPLFSFFGLGFFFSFTLRFCNYFFEKKRGYCFRRPFFWRKLFFFALHPLLFFLWKRHFFFWSAI